jgi:ribose transport system substrate-binding protein
MLNAGSGRRSKALFKPAIGLFAVALVFSACSGGASPSPAASSPPTSTPAASTQASSGAPSSAASPSGSAAATGSCPLGTDPDAALAKIPTGILGKGPNGEDPTLASSLTLTPDEMTKLKGMNSTAAIVMHITGDWTNAQVAGQTDTLKTLGINVIATTNAGGKTEKQVSDIETALVQKPNVVISIPWSPADEVAAYRKVVDSGAKLVFIGNAVPGFVAGKDYVATVAPDDWGNGVASAYLMAKALKTKNGDYKGSIGVVWFDVDFYVTNQRRDGFRATIKDCFPNITIAEDQGFASGPDLAGAAGTVASAMLVRNANLDGIWAVWDQPAEGVLAAARAAGRNDLIITTEDLGLTAALSIKKGEYAGTGAQRPYDQGVAEAMLAAYGLLGKTAPPYVADNAFPVSKDNLLDAWKAVYHTDPPATLTNP